MPPMRMVTGWRPKGRSTKSARDCVCVIQCNVFSNHQYYPPQPLFNASTPACTMSSVCEYYTVLQTAITDLSVSLVESILLLKQRLCR